MSGLRNRIDRIGEEILDKYCPCQSSSTSGSVMIPPVPDSKFFEKFLEEGELKGRVASYIELQDAYIAEVKVYRCFEELKRDVLVIHQIEYTHKQYSAFVPQHDCNKKRCNHEPEARSCHQPDKNIDGENDFVVIGPDFVAVFEVKGLEISDNIDCASDMIKGCCEDAARQRNRMVNLVKHLNSSIDVYQFTIFPNISRGEVDEGYLSDTTLVFSEELENLTSWFDMNIPSSVTDLDSINSTMSSIKFSLLGLWCINKDNEWDTSDCSFPKCIIDIDTKVRGALVTERAVYQFKENSCMKHKSKKRKVYPENPGIVEAPKLFEDYLNISCLTQDQLDVFYSEERFL